MNGRLLITALLNICFLTVSSKGLSGQESQDAFSSFYGSPVVSPTVMKGNLSVSYTHLGKVFRSGDLKQERVKAAIDFAAERGIQYVHMDAGWYGPEMKMSSDATTCLLYTSRCV